MKEVTKAKFESYLKKWPRLKINVVTVCDPPAVEYYCNGDLVAWCYSDDRAEVFEPHGSGFHIFKGEGK